MKYKISITYILLLVGITLFAQKTLILESEIGMEYNFKEKKVLWETCDSLMFKLIPTNKFTQKELDKINEKCANIDYSEACDDMWSIVCGDDWTDEGYNIAGLKNFKFCTVSSALKPQHQNKYDERSISDLSYKTAWVEGVKGYGIGETVAFKFRPGHPRITKVIIANGYIKSKKAWKNNTRVKQLKMYLNNIPFAILNLKDVYAEQTFSIPTIGNKIKHHTYNNGIKEINILDKNNNPLKPNTIRFEIISVYKGNKYKDTAITEIYFDGLDVY